MLFDKGQMCKDKYRYQFVREGVAVFRYDNAPHHEHVSTHPHHKHVGTQILPSIEPDFRQVLAEAVTLVNETTGVSGKKRRQKKAGKP